MDMTTKYLAERFLKKKTSATACTITRYLTEDEQRRLLASISQSAAVLARRDFAWISLLRDTGLRINEFRLTDVGDARAWLRDGRIFIPRERRKGGRRDHDVTLFEAGRDHVQRLLSVCAQMNGCPVESLADRDPLVVSRKGCRMTVRGYEQRMKVWARAAGITTAATPHWLRHTRAMNIMRRSTSQDPRGLVQVALGHADIRSSGIYTRPSREDVERELQIVEGRGRAKRNALRQRFDERRAG